MLQLSFPPLPIMLQHGAGTLFTKLASVFDQVADVVHQWIAIEIGVIIEVAVLLHKPDRNRAAWLDIVLGVKGVERVKFGRRNHFGLFTPFPIMLPPPALHVLGQPHRVIGPGLVSVRTLTSSYPL